MFVTELVLRNLFQVYLAALRWIISSLLMLDLVYRMKGFRQHHKFIKRNLKVNSKSVKEKAYIHL
jgi:hypothetical protein